MKTTQVGRIGNTAPDPDDLPYFASRLTRAFAERKVQPYHALQYRLCEVGPRRFDARDLSRALRSAVKAEAGVTEPIPGVYATTDLTGSDAGTAAAGALETVRQIAGLDAALIQSEVSQAVGALLETDMRNAPALVDTPTRLTAGVYCQRYSAVLPTPLQSNPFLVWITHELPWIYPDDTRLWSVLDQAQRNSARVIVLARKISPAAFSLFRALGIYGVEYYAMLVPNEVPETLIVSADQIGWPNLLRVSRLVSHPALGRVGDAVRNPTAMSKHESTLTSSAITEGIRRGFASGDGPTARALLEWTDQSGLDMPEVWRRGIQRWERSARPPHQTRKLDRLHRSEVEAHRSPDQPVETKPRPHGETTVEPVRVAAEVTWNEWRRLTERLRSRAPHSDQVNR